MNTEIQRMLAKYPLVSPSSSKDALKEIIQEITLLALSRTDFFTHAAFYGGTALRIFHGLDRFSEDMDFSLQSKNPNFMLEKYLPTIEKELESYGFSLEARIKPKQHISAVPSAFHKGNTLVHMVRILSLPPPVAGIPSNELMKIKIEIDTNPPEGATFEQKCFFRHLKTGLPRTEDLAVPQLKTGIPFKKPGW